MSIKPPFARRRELIRNVAVNRPPTEVEAKTKAKTKAKMKIKANMPDELAQARDEEGQFLPDDPATPDVNEAFVDGVPIKPAWSPTMNKKQLLSIASGKGVEGLSMADTKKTILAALDEASL